MDKRSGESNWDRDGLEELYALMQQSSAEANFKKLQLVPPPVPDSVLNSSDEQESG